MRLWRAVCAIVAAIWPRQTEKYIGKAIFKHSGDFTRKLTWATHCRNWLIHQEDQHLWISLLQEISPRLLVRTGGCTLPLNTHHIPFLKKYCKWAREPLEISESPLYLFASMRLGRAVSLGLSLCRRRPLLGPVLLRKMSYSKCELRAKTVLAMLAPNTILLFPLKRGNSPYFLLRKGTSGQLLVPPPVMFFLFSGNRVKRIIFLRGAQSTLYNENHHRTSG